MGPYWAHKLISAKADPKLRNPELGWEKNSFPVCRWKMLWWSFTSPSREKPAYNTPSTTSTKTTITKYRSTSFLRNVVTWRRHCRRTSFQRSVNHRLIFLQKQHTRTWTKMMFKGHITLQCSCHVPAIDVRSHQWFHKKNRCSQPPMILQRSIHKCNLVSWSVLFDQQITDVAGKEHVLIRYKVPGVCM